MPLKNQEVFLVNTGCSILWMENKYIPTFRAISVDFRPGKFFPYLNQIICSVLIPNTVVSVHPNWSNCTFSSVSFYRHWHWYRMVGHSQNTCAVALPYIFWIRARRWQGKYVSGQSSFGVLVHKDNKSTTALAKLDLANR